MFEARGFKYTLLAGSEEEIEAGDLAEGAHEPSSPSSRPRRGVGQRAPNCGQSDSASDSEHETEPETDQRWGATWSAFAGEPAPSGDANIFQRCTGSRACGNFTLVVIVANTVVMALEADYPKEPYWSSVDNVFLSFYVVEVGLRILAEPLAFWTSSNNGWNIFEFVLVILGVVDQWILPLVLQDESDGGFNHLSRFIRVSRVLRTLRLFNKFEKMRWVLQGLQRSAVCVFWIAVFLLVLILGYATFIVNIVSDVDDFWDIVEENDGVEQREDLELRFGSVGSTMETLFTWLTFDDWSDAARSVNAMFWWMELVWISYIVLGGFLFLSLVTGIAADKMNEVRQEETENGGVSTHSRFEELLEEVDGFADGELSFDEFFRLLSRPEVASRMAECGCAVDDEAEARELFEAAAGESGASALSWRELSWLLECMLTDSVGKHACIVEGQIRRLLSSLAGPAGEGQWERDLDSLGARASIIGARVTVVESTLRDFFKLHGYEPPRTDP